MITIKGHAEIIDIKNIPKCDLRVEKYFLLGVVLNVKGCIFHSILIFSMMTDHMCFKEYAKIDNC